jgi:hypothetical protein
MFFAEARLAVADAYRLSHRQGQNSNRLHLIGSPNLFLRRRGPLEERLNFKDKID